MASVSTRVHCARHDGGHGMNSPCCEYPTNVIDSREIQIETHNAIRRRRVCNNCSRRYTTYETYDSKKSMVPIVDGARQAMEILKEALSQYAADQADYGEEIERATAGLTAIGGV